MDIHRLRVLRAVIADGSIRGAAASLKYTPSAISQHLATLQKETGLRLVERSGRGIEPTEAGRLVAREAGRVFDRLAGLESLVADLRSGHLGTLSISYFSSAGSAWIPSVVAAISREFPQLRLDLRLIELLAADSSPSDIEISVDGWRPTAGYRVHPLLTEPYLAVVPVTSELAGRTEIDLIELREQVWVDNGLSRDHCRQRLIDACATAGYSPDFRVEAHDYASAIRFVAEGMGITVVPRLGIGSLPDSAVAVPIVNPTPQRSISVHVRETAAAHPAVIRTLELLRSVQPVTSSGIG
ncbi:LysR family transcriptional regulator [Pseudonocardiaceae bacterium YIM PH 21723]|nr:LysR family transcriptional regulator [Pseudonocardiaceae bacterium YIM PH 21723]